MLNRDMSAELGGAALDREAVARAFHIGQPVKIAKADDGVPLAVIRVACGAPLVTDVATDTALGLSLEARLGWLDAQLDLVARKLDLVVGLLEGLPERELRN
jgi:hypothetical protein